MNYGFHLHKNIQVCMQSCTAFCWPFSRIKVVLALFFFAVGLGALDAQGMHIRSKTCWQLHSSKKCGLAHATQADLQK